MSRFTATQETFGEFPTINLRDTKTGATAIFALRGATLLSYSVPLKQGLFNIIDGYTTAQELAEHIGARSMIMAPFSNRIDKGHYRFNAQDHVLHIANPRDVAMHGFIGFIDFECKSMSAGDNSAEVVFVNSSIRNTTYQGYPFDVDVEVTARLNAQGIAMEIAGINHDDTPVPFGCGWHPYFKTCDTAIEHIKLTVPARTAIAVTDCLIPLLDKEAFVPVATVFENGFDVCRGSAVNGQVIDKAFTDLVADADGIMRTRIEDPQTKIRITVTQQRGLMHVFTGDTLTVRPRKSIALEPVEFMTNAFARPDCAERIILGPKQRRGFTFGVSAENI